MASHKSAAKRARQTVGRRLRNRHNLSTMRTVTKKVREAVEKKDLGQLELLFREAQSVIAVTRRKGSIHANQAARRISRLAHAINNVKNAAKAV